MEEPRRRRRKATRVRKTEMKMKRGKRETGRDGEKKNFGIYRSEVPPRGKWV